MCCVSQAWSSPASSRTDRIREHQFVNPVPSSSSSIMWAFLTGWFCDRYRILHQYFTALICCLIFNGNRPVSPYSSGMGVCFLTPRVDLINFRCIFSKSLTLSPVYHISLAYSNMGCIWQSKTLNAITDDNLPTTGRDCVYGEKTALPAWEARWKNLWIYVNLCEMVSLGFFKRLHLNVAGFFRY